MRRGMEMNMGNQKVGQGIPVCKNCGAMGRPGNLHCVFCGAALESETQLPRHTTGAEPQSARAAYSVPRPAAAPETARAAAANGPERPKPAVTALGILSLAAGLLALLVLALSTVHSGFLPAAAAVVLGAVNLGRKRGGGLLAGIGLGLGAFVLLVQGFWSVIPLFYFF